MNLFFVRVFFFYGNIVVPIHSISRCSFNPPAWLKSNPKALNWFPKSSRNCWSAQGSTVAFQLEQNLPWKWTLKLFVQIHSFKNWKYVTLRHFSSCDSCDSCAGFRGKGSDAEVPIELLGEVVASSSSSLPSAAKAGEPKGAEDIGSF